MSLAELQRLESQNVIGTYVRQPVEFVRGEGAWLWDSAGERYLDLLCGISVTNLGHCHPRVVEAVREQAGRLIHVSNLFYTEPAMQLAERLAASSLGGKVFFCNSGAESIEAAVKLARRAKAGGGVVSLAGGFHGRTYAALSATGQEEKQAPFAPLVPGFATVAPTAEALVEAIGPDTAAVIIEPVQGEGGIRPVDGGALVAARQACDEHGAVLVFDEVQAGMGRTGTLWAYEHTGVVPDAMTTAKALGGGLPIGALVTGPALADTLRPGDHGSTFAGGPVVARAALAALEVTDDGELLARVAETGRRIMDQVAGLPGVSEVRGRGLMIGFDLEAGGAPELVGRALAGQRIVINATGPQTVRLLPPLTITDGECEEALTRLAGALEGHRGRQDGA